MIGVKFVREGAKMPWRADAGSSGWDVHAAEGAIIPAGRWRMVPTGLACDIPEFFEIQIRPRSGLAAKFGVTVLNSPGTVDSSYTGEIQVILINHSVDSYHVRAGDRIAQFVVARLVPEGAGVNGFEQVDALKVTDRGAGGFGHTGV